MVPGRRQQEELCEQRGREQQREEVQVGAAAAAEAVGEAAERRAGRTEEDGKRKLSFK